MEENSVVEQRSAISSASEYSERHQNDLWESFVDHVRRLNTTVLDNSEKTFSDHSQRTRNILLARPPSATHKQVLNEMKTPASLHTTKTVMMDKKIGNTKTDIEQQREKEDRVWKARQGWNVLRRFIDEQRRKRKRQEQQNHWRMLDRLACRARNYQLRRELYIKYGIVSSPKNKSPMQKPSKEMALRVDQMIAKFKDTHFRPLTAPPNLQSYRRVRGGRKSNSSKLNQK